MLCVKIETRGLPIEKWGGQKGRRTYHMLVKEVGYDEVRARRGTPNKGTYHMLHKQEDGYDAVRARRGTPNKGTYRH